MLGPWLLWISVVRFSLVHNQLVATDKRTDVWSRDFIIWRINSGLWAVGLGCEIKGSGPIMSNVFGPFFHFFGVKIFFLPWKSEKNGPQKLLIINPDPFISQSSPDQRPTAHNWFFILRNLGTRDLFSYLWVYPCSPGKKKRDASKTWQKNKFCIQNNLCILVCT